jgi:hypothetical protein
MGPWENCWRFWWKNILEAWKIALWPLLSLNTVIGKPILQTHGKILVLCFTIYSSVLLLANTKFSWQNTRCDPKVLRRVVLKEYCALHLVGDTITT